MARKIRVLVGKPGLDGHDRGAKVVAAALRDAGMEVIYTGLHQTCESIVEAAIQEDVDVIGLSILSGAHMTLFPKVLNLLKKRHASDIVVIGGGIIPQADMKKLEKKGVKKLFGPGTPTSEIITWIQEATVKKRSRPKRGTVKPTKKLRQKAAVKRRSGKKSARQKKKPKHKKK
ncbi:MAG: cobalamin B12-binding domain-containing protein [candidate division WOR-3 bacterium]|nr:MAG: cobalamin B12-binding domain-containing protein [candidate division WOR-3 bacterium]